MRIATSNSFGKLKKVILSGVVLMMFASVVSASSINGDYNGYPIVNLNVNRELISSDVPAINVDGTVLIPLEAVKGIFAKVDWDEETQTATILGKTDFKSMSKLFNGLLKATGIDAKLTIELSEELGIMQYVYNSSGNADTDRTNILVMASLLTSLNTPLDGVSIQIYKDQAYQARVTVGYSDIKKFTDNQISQDEFLKLWLVQNAPTITVPSTPSTPQITSSVIESRIDGDFNGWDGTTIFKLQNGQIWQQDDYKIRVAIKLSPKVIIYKSGTRYKMKVDGIDDEIYVKRLK
ncbi:copper amine oxidase N-terminal domain-containing protein [Paenibacillus allorhizosphaerae]|nr:copper amine oxidase N-terminal domain-containing protein [Paenibacillus allorhizosphaerae]